MERILRDVNGGEEELPADLMQGKFACPMDCVECDRCSQVVFAAGIDQLPQLQNEFHWRLGGPANSRRSLV